MLSESVRFAIAFWCAHLPDMSKVLSRQEILPPKRKASEIAKGLDKSIDVRLSPMSTAHDLDRYH